MRRHRLLPVTLSVLFAAASGPLHAGYRDTIGWNRLVSELGEAAPLGAGIDVGLIESPAFGGSYQPDTGNFEFAGKTFSMQSGDSGTSAHATVVGQLFFGHASSMAREIDTIDVYETNHWIFEGFLRTTEEYPPEVETRRIQNHSWAGTFTTNHDRNIEAIRRFDFAIARDRFVAVVALSNSTGDVPALLAHSYNAIVVGRPDGNHSRGGTWFDEPGRTRPDIVTPGGFFTSYSAPVISSAAAVLLNEADRSPHLANARHNPHTIKSILMAGATKAPFSNWSRTDDRPLDEVFGAGRLDVYRSYRILTSGEHQPDATVSPAAGWHLGDIASNEEATYLFSFDREQERFTANLSWHRHVTPAEGADFFGATIHVPRLELRLFETTDSLLGNEIQISIDSVNNNQHLFLQGLPAGNYALVVNRIDELPADAAYTLAWDAIPSPIVRFADWQRQFFSPEELDDSTISGPKADPDRDGVKNLFEYALGGNPLRPDRTVLPRETIAPDGNHEYLALIFTRPGDLEDVVYRVDVSGDLIEWTEGGGVPLHSLENDDGTVTEVYRDAIPLSGADRRFLRLTTSLDEGS